MGRQFLNIKHTQFCLGKNTGNRSQRKIREMLVINGVKLVLLNQAHQMRELQIYSAAFLQSDTQTLCKIIDIGDMRVHVVAANQISTLTTLSQACCRCHTKEFTQYWHANFFSGIRRAICWFHT